MATQAELAALRAAVSRAERLAGRRLRAAQSRGWDATTARADIWKIRPGADVARLNAKQLEARLARAEASARMRGAIDTGGGHVIVGREAKEYRARSRAIAAANRKAVRAGGRQIPADARGTAATGLPLTAREVRARAALMTKGGMAANAALSKQTVRGVMSYREGSLAAMIRGVPGGSDWLQKLQGMSDSAYLSAINSSHFWAAARDAYTQGSLDPLRDWAET